MQMGIGIDIRVDSSQVAAAKREVGFLNDSLRDTRELSEITIAPKGIGDLVGELKQIGTETRSAISGISEIAAGLRRLQSFRLDPPDTSRYVDSIKQAQSAAASRATAPQQPAQRPNYQPPPAAQPRQPEQPQQRPQAQPARNYDSLTRHTPLERKQEQPKRAQEVLTRIDDTKQALEASRQAGDEKGTKHYERKLSRLETV